MINQSCSMNHLQYFFCAWLWHYFVSLLPSEKSRWLCLVGQIYAVVLYPTQSIEHCMIQQFMGPEYILPCVLIKMCQFCEIQCG